MPNYYHKGNEVSLSEIRNNFFIPLHRKEDLQIVKELINEEEFFRYREGLSNTAVLSNFNEKKLNFSNLSKELQKRLNRISKHKNDKLKAYSIFETKNRNRVGVNNEFVGKLKDENLINNEKFKSYLKEHKITGLEKLKGQKNTYKFSVESGDVNKIFIVANKFAKKKQYFSYAHPNFLVEIKLSSNDTLFKKQWALNKNAYTPDDKKPLININIEEVWKIINESQINLNPVGIMVIDKGIDLHEDYQIQMNRASNIAKHGTEVTGIIAAISGNGKGVSGIEPRTISFPNFKIYGVNYSDDFNTIESDREYIDLASFIETVLLEFGKYDPPPKVVNLSINFPFDTEMEALDELFDIISESCLICNSVGNFDSNGDNTIQYPAYKSSILSVAGVDHMGSWVSLSNNTWGSCIGPEVDICAPATQIVTTSPIYGNYNHNFFGTSAATAFVSGVAALLFAINPDLSPEDVKEILCESANDKDVFVSRYGKKINDDSKSEYIGKGLLDAFAAFEMARPQL